MTYAPITVAARRVLLDALDALGGHRHGLVLVGAQAIYLYTGDSDVAIATNYRGQPHRAHHPQGGTFPKRLLSAARG